MGLKLNSQPNYEPVGLPCLGFLSIVTPSYMCVYSEAQCKPVEDDGCNIHDNIKHVYSEVSLKKKISVSEKKNPNK